MAERLQKQVGSGAVTSVGICVSLIQLQHTVHISKISRDFTSPSQAANSACHVTHSFYMLYLY